METKLFEFAVKYGFWKGGPYLHICEPNWEFIESIEDFKNGKDRTVGFLIGQIMKKAGGKINPSLTSELLLKELSKR